MLLVRDVSCLGSPMVASASSVSYVCSRLAICSCSGGNPYDVVCRVHPLYEVTLLLTLRSPMRHSDSVYPQCRTCLVVCVALVGSASICLQWGMSAVAVYSGAWRQAAISTSP